MLEVKWLVNMELMIFQHMAVNDKMVSLGLPEACLTVWISTDFVMAAKMVQLVVVVMVEETHMVVMEQGLEVDQMATLEVMLFCSAGEKALGATALSSQPYWIMIHLAKQIVMHYAAMVAMAMDRTEVTVKVVPMAVDGDLDKVAMVMVMMSAVLTCHLFNLAKVKRAKQAKLDLQVMADWLVLVATMIHTVIPMMAQTMEDLRLASEYNTVHVLVHCTSIMYVYV